MDKLELGNCLTIINGYESKLSELSSWRHGLDLGKLFKPEIFEKGEGGSLSSIIKLFDGEDEQIFSFSYDEIYGKDGLIFYCQLHIDEMVVDNITFELFEYLVKNKMNNYIMIKQIKNR